MDLENDRTYKYCSVPLCENTTITAPDKFYFLIPKDAGTRKIWCNIMGREGDLSSKTCLYCCEDHFNIENDTKNYMEYKIMALQEGHETPLRLKKGIIPHKFLCQKSNGQQQTSINSATLKRKPEEIATGVCSDFTSKSKKSVDILESEESAQMDYYAAGPSMSSRLQSEHKSQQDFSPCLQKADKAIQVKAHYRSKGVNVKSLESKSVAVSTIPVIQKDAATLTSGLRNYESQEYELITNNSQPSTCSLPVSSDYEPNTPSSETSLAVEDDSEEENFKKAMRGCTFLAIEKEPKMLIGLPKTSYYLIKLLSENTSLAMIDILITLKKFKLNESFHILALQFGYAQSTISRIFSKTIPILAHKMKDLVVWPTPQQIYEKLPVSFRARFSNVVSIIDCLEIQIERPSNPVHQALTWSQYKKCNTLKYLISCTPDGLVNFISEGYGGRATDVTIVQECGYLKCLPADKAVMADRGFKDLTHLLEKKKCTLVRPPSVSQSTPSSKEEVKLSRQIAALRIHVERVINRLREFHILLPHACVDHNLIPLIDEVLVIACGMINLQDVLIKK